MDRKNTLAADFRSLSYPIPATTGDPDHIAEKISGFYPAAAIIIIIYRHKN